MPKDIDVKFSISGDGSVTAGLKKVDTGLEKVEKQAKETSTATKGLWKEFALGAVAVQGAALAFRVLKTQLIESIKLASDAEETASKFGVVFKDSIDVANEAVKDLNENWGLASSTAQKLLSDTGDILAGFGFSSKATIDLSKQVNELAIDLASFTNIEGGAEVASKALTAAMVGETERAKALGIVIRQDSDEFKNLVSHGIKVEGMTLLQAKAMAALTIAVNQSQNAIGDYNRTSDSFANVTKELGERVKEVQELFGKAFADAILPLLNEFKDWLVDNKDEMVSFFEGVGAAVKEFILTVAETKRVFSDFFDAAARLAGAPVDLRNEMKAGAKSMKDFGKEVGVFVKGPLALMNPALDKVGESLDDVKKKLDDPTDFLGTFFGNEFKKATEAAAKVVREELKKALEEAAKAAKKLEEEYQTAMNNIRDTAADRLKKLGVDVETEGEKMQRSLKETGDAIMKDFDKPLKIVAETAKETSFTVLDMLIDFEEQWEELNLLQKVNLISNAFDQLGIDGGEAFDLLKSGVKGFASLLSGDIVGGLAGLFSTGFGIGKLLSPEKSKTEAEVFTDTANQFKEIYKWALLSTEQAKLVLQGTIEIEEAIGSNFQKMASEADIATKAMFNLMNTAKEQGLEVAEIQAFINRNLVAGVDALKLYTGKFQTEFADDFAAMLQSQGNSLQDIVNMMGDTAPEALKKFVEENKRVLDNISGLDGILKSLANTQNLTEAGFKKIQNQGFNAFNQLIQGGASEEESLRAILPLLKDQIEASELYGFSLNKNTQDLIDQAREAGLSFEDQKSASDLMVEGIDRIGDAIDRLVDLFSDDLPQAIGKSIGAVDVLGESMGSLPAPGSEFSESAPGAGSRNQGIGNGGVNVGGVNFNMNANIEGKNLDPVVVRGIVSEGMRLGLGDINNQVNKLARKNA